LTLWKLRNSLMRLFVRPVPVSVKV